MHQAQDNHVENVADAKENATERCPCARFVKDTTDIASTTNIVGRR